MDSEQYGSAESDDTYHGRRSEICVLTVSVHS